MESKYGQPWNREELILALALYCQIPFSATSAKNPRVQLLAERLGRTPASVARKLGSFGSLDERLAQKGISGLPHTSRLDKEAWEAFKHDLGSLAVMAHVVEKSLHIPTGETEGRRMTKTRLVQAFFRQAVLSGYNYACCVTGIDEPGCLIACHIVPWSADPRNRANPSNGLCLSATFERLFDCGLMTVTATLRVRFASQMKAGSSAPVEEHILRCEGKQIQMPTRFCPDASFLSWHRENVFRDRFPHQVQFCSP